MFKLLKKKKHPVPVTAETLARMPDDELENLIYEHIAFKIGNDYTRDFEIVSSLSKGQQAIYSIWQLEAEVNNGGFNQFYFNPSGRFARMAAEGLRLIGTEKFAELTARANTVYLENKDKLAEFDDGTLESFSASYENNPLNELDELFFELYDQEDLNEKKVRYIRNNIQDFFD